VLLFGSLATGTPTPRSDADLLVVVATSDRDQPRDRVPEVLRAFAPLPCPLDLFVLTAQEVERAREGNEPLVRLALTEGIDLL
jgi:predicted nucleotidyltransferase